MARPKYPKLPFPHKTRRDESTSNIFKQRCISIQRILLHMFQPPLLRDQQMTLVTRKWLAIHLFFFRLFA
jgi:hypothetical protein